MFLPFGINNGRDIGEMLPLCVERILKMKGVSETYSTIPVFMLMVALSNTIEKNMCRSRKDECRTYPKEPFVSSNNKETSYNFFS